ncbi:hypothetical protein F5Y01DRAFT_292100, partial [Xylaria sp. FL0043]
MGNESTELAERPSHVSPDRTCSYTSSETNLWTVDPDGDLGLQVGQITCVNISPSDGGQDHEHELPVVFIVCSRALSRASRVWRTLLYGGFAESKPSFASSASDWVVKLPEDDPRAMGFILDIIHSRFESLPRINESIDTEFLYQLTVLTDKYDLTAIVRPWASTWMGFIENTYGSVSTAPEAERLLWVAWVMGDFNLYKRAFQCLALNCHVDANGNLQYFIRDEAVPLFGSTLEPPGLHELLKRSRWDGITAMLNIYKAATNTLIYSPPASKPTTVCGQKSGNSACEAAVLGTMIKSLASYQYWPLPEASHVRTCFSSTKHTLSHINIKSPVHSDCTGIKGRDLTSLRNRMIKVDIPSSIAERMAKQAEKSGLWTEPYSLDGCL